MERLWITRELNRKKKRKHELGSALNLPPSRVSEIIKGKRKIQSNEINLLADFLEIETFEILNHIALEYANGHSPKSCLTETIPVIGEYQKTKNKYSLWDHGRRYNISLPTHTSFRESSKFALEGPSDSQTSMHLYICLRTSAISTPPLMMNGKKYTEIHTLDGHSLDSKAIIVGHYRQF